MLSRSTAFKSKVSSVRSVSRRSRLYATETMTQEAETQSVVKSVSRYGIAFHSPTWTKYLGDILASEAEIPIPMMKPESLHKLYQKQHQEFLDAKEDMMKEKVSEGAYEGLRKIFVLRAALPIEAIEKGLDVAGITAMQRKGLKNTVAEHFPAQSDGVDWESNASFLDKWRQSIIPKKQSYPKNLLSGLTGFFKASDKGLTNDQLTKSRSLLASDSGEIVQMDKPSKLINLDQSSQGKIELLRQGKIEEAFPMNDGLNDTEIQQYKDFVEEQKQFWKQETAEQQLELSELASNSEELATEKAEELLSLFSEKSINDDTDVIKRLTQYNPLGEALVMNNLIAMSTASATFTEDFSEYSGMKLRTEDPTNSPGRKGFDSTTAILNSNVGFGDPIVAAEQIMELKLDRLASFYGLNLDNDLDNLRFHVFMDKFEVSPGESGLDWVMTYPPAHHTFEELPIVKIPHDEDVEDYYKRN